MRVTLIRHGRTPGNAQGRYIGRTDEPLAQEGIGLPEGMERDPSVRTVYVSPLRRTRQTAEILFPQAEQIPVDALREMDFGVFEGRNCAEMAEDADYRAWVEGGCTAACPGGEGREDFSDRVCGAFAEILARAERRGEAELVFVVHGGTIMAVMERFALPRKGFYDYSVKNGGGYRCEAEGSGQELTLRPVTAWGQV